MTPSLHALTATCFSSWTSLHYKYTAAARGEPAFIIIIIIRLAARLNHPKRGVIAGTSECPLLPACQPVEVPLVGLIRLDLISNEQCGPPRLLRPRVVIFISHSLSQIFHLIYPSLRWGIASLPSAFMMIWGSIWTKIVLFCVHLYNIQHVWKMLTFCFLCFDSNKHVCTALAGNHDAKCLSF